MNPQEIPSADSQSNTKAPDHCSAGIESLLRMQADAMAHIDAAIAADESFALPLLVKAWMLHGGRDANAANAVSSLMFEAVRCLPSTNCREAELLWALKLARAGRGIEGASVLEKLLLRSPTDLLVHQLIHEEIFWTGQFDWMRKVVERAAPAWNETLEGYGHFLSIRAFANEESGYIDDAERYGRLAVEIDPADIWGTHAVAHALLMKGEIRKGVDWLESLSPNWGYANQMSHHLWWHMCLFLLELGQHDRILDLLTTEVRNPDSALVQASPAAPIDIQNYSSLLLRLELYGVDVGSHWDTLGPVCGKRTHNHGNAFGNVHDMMVLAATGQFDKASELLESMHNQYDSQRGSVALAYNSVGIPACKAILAYRKKDYKGVLNLLGGVRHDLNLLGASHAQRDVFYHLLVHAAEQEERDDLRANFLSDIDRIGFREVSKRAAYRNRAH